MKIAIVGPSLFKHGAEYVMAALARGLSAKGHQVDVILSKYHILWQKQHADWIPFELPQTVRVVTLPQCRARYSILSLHRLFKKEEYNVVMCHASNYSLPLAIASIGCHRRTKFINVVHSCGVGVDEQGNRIERSSDLRTRLVNGIKRLYEAQFAVSSGTADAISRMTGFPRDRITPVFNPVVDDIFHRKLHREPDHPWLNDASIPVVMAAGVFQPYKNHLMLLDAFAEVVKMRKARLIIFGDGPLKSAYERKIDELQIGGLVSFPGHTENLPAAMARSACYVVSSTVESFSVVCVEALAAGVPVVSTNCPYGPPEILRNGKYGILVENKNQNALADGILKVLNGQGVKPPPESWQPYTMDAIVERYETAMHKLMEGKS